MINNVKENFTIVTNVVLNEKTVSLGAKGLYSFLMSKPDDWKFSYAGLSHQLKEGEKKIRLLVKELVDLGVLLRIPKRIEHNKFNGWEWILHPGEEYSDKIDPKNYGKGLQNTEVSQMGSTVEGKEISNTHGSNTNISNNIKKKCTSFLEEKKDDISNFDFNSTYTSLDNEIVNEQEVDIISNDIIDENDKRKNKQKESGGGRKNYDKMNNDLMDKLMFHFGFNYDDVKISMSGYSPNPKDIRNACVDIYNFSNEVKKEYGIDLDIKYTYDIINLFRYHFNLDRRKDMLQYIEDHGDEINNIDDLLRETERFNIM